ncbi:MAG: LCP family protein [Lachnospiraceae bacterium]
MNKIKEKILQIKDRICDKVKNMKEKPKAQPDIEDKLNGVEIIDDDSVITIPQKKKMKRWKKGLIICGSVVAGIIVILVSVFMFLRISGKSSLYGRATSERPNLNRENQAEENIIGSLDIDPENMDNIIVIGDDDTEETGGNTSGESHGTKENQGGSSKEDSNKLSFEGAGEESGYDVIYNGEKYVYNEDMITLLFLGIDTKEAVKPAEDGVSGGQSDALFLLILNPHTNIMDIIAIHRNSIALVDIYDKNGNYTGTGYTQICLQHAYGGGMEKSNEMTKNSVSRMLYDLPIHSVTSINMGAVPELNDSVGGITLNSLETFEADGYSFIEGQQVKLKGDNAYTYVHYRNMYVSDSAGMRLNRQKQYITSFINTALAQVKNDIGKVVDVYNIISKYVVTDLSIDEMTYLASELISYKFGGIYSIEGELDKNPKWKYERYNLNQDALYEMLIDKFYEKVE